MNRSTRLGPARAACRGLGSRSPTRVGAGLVALVLASAVAWAGTPAGYTEYIIPFDEDIFVFVTDPLAFDAIPADRPTSAIISLTVWSDATTIYVDHWEDGYSFDPANPDATADEKYTGNLGETLNFVSDPIPRPRTGADGNTYIGAAGDCNPQAPPKTPVFRNTTTYCYDGRDYIYVAGGASTMTRGGWIEGSGGNTLGPRAAIGEEVYPLAPQLIRYVLPFGEGSGGSSYERVIAVIQATEDNTQLRIDFDGDGTFDAFNTENGYRTPRVDPVDSTVLTLQRGESYVLDRDSDGVGGLLAQDAIILGSKTLQVEYFYGEDNGSYDTRAVAAYPRGFWGRNYYAVVDGAPGGADTDILLYNPSLTDTITITWTTQLGTGSFTLTPQESAFFEAKTGAYVPEGSAVYLSGTDRWWGFSDIDVNSAAYDWGYSLMPDNLLEDEQTVAYAPGNIENDDPLDFPPCNAAEGRDDGIFVTPAFDNTTFFIDTNGDDIPDTNASIEVLIGTTVQTATASGGYVGNRLESLYITGSNVGTTAASDCDLTGARIWATGPFTMAYGENPEKASPAGGLDLGYTVLPNPGDWMELVLTVDKSTSPVVLSTAAGATATYTLVVRSQGYEVDSVSVVDTLPANWEYVAGSTTITLPNLTQISGGAADPTVSLPTLSWGSGLLGSLLTNQTITITFQARTTAAFNPGDLTRNLVAATGTRTVSGTTQTFNARDFVFNTYQDTTVGLGITKTSSVPEPTPVSPGDPLTYTVQVENPIGSTAPLTNVWIGDPLPTGVSYVPGSGLVSGCFVSENVRDEFGTVSYVNDDGSQSWAAGWNETDALGGGPAAGAVQVTSGALRIGAMPATVSVRDQFDTAGYGFGNDGSVDWANGWTETGDDGNLGAGNVEIETTNRIELQGGAGTNASIQRDVIIAGATSATVSFDFEDAASNNAGFDDAAVEYSIDGGAFTNLFTMNQGDPTGNYLTTFPVSGTRMTLRFRQLQPLEGGDYNAFDNVQVTHDGLGGLAVRDEFNTTGSGAGSNGRAAWTGNWVETGDNGNFATGDIAVEQGRLEFRDTADAGDSVHRDLSITGATSATISFDFADVGIDGNDDVIVEYSTNGGATYTTVFTLDGNSANTGYISTVAVSGTTMRLRLRLEDNIENNEEVYFDNVQVIPNRPPVGGTPAANDRAARTVDLSGAASATLTFSSTTSGTLDPGEVYEVRVGATPSFAGSTLLESVSDDGAFAGSYDLTPYMSATTTVFFVVASGVNALDEWRSFDDVNIAFTDARSDFASGFPPDFLPASEACVLPPGNTVTLSFGVTVDDPFPTGQDEIVNTASSAAIEIPIPQSASARNIVIVPSSGSATVGDRVWLDADGDGVLDPGEAGLPGIQVTLRDYWGTPVQVTTTDSQGRYIFIDVEPGNGYFVEVTGGLPAGLTQTTDGRTDLRTNDFDLADGQDYLDADLGFRASSGTASIGDTVWVDVDSDQIRDPGEVGLAGITVELYEDTDGNGTGDVLVTSRVTGPGGTYVFTNIPADGALDYVVSIPTGQAGLTGYTSTTPTSYSYLNLPSGSVRVDADFGFLPPVGGAFTISDGIWLDDGAGGGGAADGVKNGGESGIAGVTVSLLDSGGNQIATATSDASGNFYFAGVPAGQNYSWRITDDDHVLADLYGTTTYAQAGREQLVGTLSGNVDHTANPHFGYNATRAIGDTVWNDLDGDGVQQAGEPGIAGVTVLLYRDADSDGVFEPGGDDGAPVGSVVTSGTGFYLFSGLSDGRYWVSIDDTQASLASFDTLTTGDQEPNAGDQREVVLSGGANQLGEDFGYRATSGYALSGRLWNDADDDGVDDGEPGFSGVTLELVSGGVVVGTTTSGANGSYSFPGLPDGGTYTVRFTDVNGVLTGFDTTYEKTEGPLAGSYDGQEVATISGADITDLDFGFYNPNRSLTLAIVSSFAAYEESGSVVIEWTTSAEIGTIGFDLYRYERESGWVPVNEGLLPALLGAGQQGGTYRFVDDEASTGRWYWYLLVEAEDSGARNPMGPYRVNTRATVGDDDGGARRVALGRRLARRFAASDHVDRDRLRERGRRGRGRWSDRGQGGPRAEGRRGGRGRGFRGGDQLKISVEQPGIHFVSREELAAAGFEVGRGRLMLRRGGQSVALGLAPDGSGLYFWARDPGTLGAGRDVYWLAESWRGEAMGSRSDARARPRGGETFLRRVAREEEVLPAPQIFSDPDGDFTLWDYTFGGWPAKVLGFRADGAAGAGRARVTVRLVGGNDTPAAPDHHVVIRVNGQAVGELSLEGLEAVETTHEFAAGLLVDGENTLSVEALADTGAWYSLVWIDSFEVLYESRYQASGDRLDFSSEDNGSIFVSGFSRPDILVFDVTDPARAVSVAGRVEQLADGSWGVALRAPRPGTLYSALTPGALLAGELALDRPSRLRSRRNAAEYVVITVPELAEAAQKLADHRGLSALVVDVEDIYDEFNFGVPSPHAIRAFLAHARSRWATPPRYVVLAGSGTIEYGASHPYGGNLIPPALVATPDGLAASDVWFADVDPATAAPELAIGRLPASTPEELFAMVAKIQAREQGGGAWLDRIVLASDNPDKVGDFPADHERLAALVPPGFVLDRIDLSRLPVATARGRLIAALQEGAGFVSYLGHAGYDVLADEGLLRGGDVAGLANADRPTVLAALTCVAGNFSSPYAASLGEKLLLHPGGGAAAVWAPTWLSENEHAVALGEHYYAAAFARPGVRIGDAIVAAMRGYDQTWRPDYILFLYTLLGDPAMPLGR